MLATTAGSTDEVAASAALPHCGARLAAGDSQALYDLDPSALVGGKKREFKFLGVYSGTFGTTKLAEIALGKCWHIDTLRETIEHPRRGQMPAHAPVENEHYAELLREVKGKLILRDANGNLKAEFFLD